MSKKDSRKSSKPVDDTKTKVNYEELIMANVSDFKLVADNTGYHYTTVNLRSKNLDVLTNTFNNYKYIESIDLSENNLMDFTMLSNMPFLIRINLESNSIKDLKPLANEESFKSLKYLNLAKNKIVELSPIKVGALIFLNLTENKVEKTEAFDGHPKIKQLYLNGNKIAALTQLVNLPELKKLKLGENKLKTLQGLEAMGGIQVLKVKKNQIDQFEEVFPTMENLQYLDIRDNKIEKFDEIIKLAVLPNLRKLSYGGNNITKKHPNYLLDTVNTMLRLTQINSVFVTKALKTKAFRFSEEKYKKEQEIKRLQEEEERAKEAAAAQQD